MLSSVSPYEVYTHVYGWSYDGDASRCPHWTIVLDRLKRVALNDTADEPEPAYHLFLDQDEVPVTAGALRLLISDEAHEPQIRGLARAVLTSLDAPPGDSGKLTVPLSPEQMKITHSAARLLLDDLQREQAGEREVLRRVLDKLPDEHTMRAITLG